MSRHASARWILLAAIVLAVILLPFLAFGNQIESWAADFLHNSGARSGWTAVMVGLLLVLDIFLPIPSSIVSTGAGFLLGFIGGTAASFFGMTAGCLLGYAVGFSSRRVVALRLVGKEEMSRLENLFGRYGDWAMVIARPIPVLAEASVLFAGLGGMRLHRFLWISMLSNLGISAVYGAIGAFSFSVDSFLLALAAAILVPAIVMFATKSIRRLSATPG